MLNLCVQFNKHHFNEITRDKIADSLTRKDQLLWVDILDPDSEDIEMLQQVFKFHPLSIEDVTNQRQRPKAEEYTDHIFLIVNTVSVEDGELNFREVDIFVGENYIVTVHNEHEEIIQMARQRIESERLKIAHPTSNLLHALIDTVIDSYLPLLEKIDQETDQIETMLIESPNAQLVNQLLSLKRNLNEIWWVAWPYQNMIGLLMNSTIVFQEKKSHYYLRDITDHVRRIMDLINMTRDTIPSLINLYMSAISNEVNIAVNRLTIITIVIGVLAVVSSFYGMNFEQTWPPFGAAWGVPVVMVIMLSITTVLYLLLKVRNLTE